MSLNLDKKPDGLKFFEGVQELIDRGYLKGLHEEPDGSLSLQFELSVSNDKSYVLKYNGHRVQAFAAVGDFQNVCDSIYTSLLKKRR